MYPFLKNYSRLLWSQFLLFYTERNLVVKWTETLDNSVLCRRYRFRILMLEWIIDTLCASNKTVCIEVALTLPSFVTSFPTLLKSKALWRLFEDKIFGLFQIRILSPICTKNLHFMVKIGMNVHVVVNHQLLYAKYSSKYCTYTLVWHTYDKISKGRAPVIKL